jgi:Holliday junction resolvase RusA-like endonuclease
MHLELRIPRRLESPNQSRGGHWRVRHRITRAWEEEIALAAKLAGSWPPDGHTSRRRVTIERHVPSRRNFVRDADNLRFSVKPVLDSLTRLGFIRNDSRVWLDHPEPTQHVSADGSDYTVIRIEAVP